MQQYWYYWTLYKDWTNTEFRYVVKILNFRHLIDPWSPGLRSRLIVVRLRHRPKIKKSLTYYLRPSLFLTFEGFKSSIFDVTDLKNLKGAFAHDTTELPHKKSLFLANPELEPFFGKINASSRGSSKIWRLLGEINLKWYLGGRCKGR